MFFHKMAEAGQIQFLDRADSWQQAVRLSCSGLVASGAVDSDYAEQVIACVEKYGPYIVVLPGLAIPHCNEGNPSVYRSTIAYTKFREEVVFPFPEDERSASVFFALAASDPDTHLENMKQLFDILSEDEVLRQVQDAESVEDLLKIKIPSSSNNI